MATLYTIGLEQIKFSGQKIGQVYKDTCKVTQERPDRTEHFEEGKKFPAVASKEDKPIQFEFAIMNPDAQFLQTHMGGTYDSATKKWSFGGETSTAVVSGSWELEPKKGFKSIKIAKGDADATIDFEVSDKGILLVRFVVTPMQPETGAPVEITEKTTP